MKLSHDRWYSRGGQRKLRSRAFEESSATRKIIGLSLLLALVIALMQQLADPTKYVPVFSAVGLTQTAQSAKPGGLIVNEKVTGPAGSLRATKIELPMVSDTTERARQAWLVLLKALEADSIVHLATVEFRSGQTEGISKELTSGLKNWFEETEQRLATWKPTLSTNELKIESSEVTRFNDEFASQWLAWARLYREGIHPASSALNPEIRAGLRLAIDQRLLTLIHDAEPWRPIERTSLARTLERAEESRTQMIELAKGLDQSQALRMGSLLEVPSLSKQAQEIRGTMVRLRGIPASSPAASQVNAPGWGSIQYDVIWLRPDGFSQQPICIYHLKNASPSSGWPTIRDSSSKTENGTEGIAATDVPLMEVTGFLIKRLAYSSQRGIDVAPVLVTFDAQWVSDLEAKHLVVARDAVSRSQSMKWIEPGTQTQNLDLLSEIFASDLESLRDDTVLKTLTDVRFGQSDDVNQESNRQIELNTVVQILHQIPRVSKPLKAALPTQSSIGPAQLGTLRGLVDEIRVFENPNALDDDGKPLKHFRLRVASQHEGETHYVFANHIPREWQVQAELSQPIEVEGLQLEQTVDNETHRLWFTNQPRWSWAWLPDDSKHNLSPTSSSDWNKLGRIGFDLGQAAMVHRLSKQSLTKGESEAFFSLINATDKLMRERSMDRSTTVSTPTMSIFDCLNNNPQDTFREIAVRVHVVRVTPIIVSDELDQMALEGDRYYELDGLVDIRGKPVRLKSADGKTNLDFNDDFPVTLVCKRLPSWFSPSEQDASALVSQAKLQGGDGEGDQVVESVWYPRRTIEVEGNFYRLWSYGTAQTRQAVESTSQSSEASPRFLQSGPLISISHWKDSWQASTPSQKPYPVKEMVTGVGLALLLIYIIFRVQSTGRKKRRQKAA